MKRINITSIILLVYLLVMSIIGWPGKQEEPNYVEYFIVIGITLAIIGLLRYLQIRRFKIRQQRREEKNKTD